MWRSLVNLFLLTIGLFSLVTFHASLRSSPLSLLLRTTSWKAIKKSSEIIRSPAVGFLVCFCFLLSLTFCCQNLCSFVLFSESGWASLVLPFSSASQPLPPALPLIAAGRKVTLGDSLGEILGSLNLVAEFPLTSAWPGFHPLALKCSVLLRASTSVSSAFLQALWLHQQLDQKEWCHGATGLGKEFLGCQVLH